LGALPYDSDMLRSLLRLSFKSLPNPFPVKFPHFQLVDKPGAWGLVFLKTPVELSRRQPLEGKLIIIVEH
jgi:hypothetical protein